MRRLNLIALYAAHSRQFVRYALVTIDAGLLAKGERGGVLIRCPGKKYVRIRHNAISDTIWQT